MIQKRHFQPLLDIFKEDIQELLKQNVDLPWLTVASPQIVSFHETSCEGMEEKHKITEFTVAFKYISYI